MKYVKLIAFLFSSVLFFYACTDSSTAETQQTSDPANVTTPSTPLDLTTPPPATPEPAQNSAGVWHYTCSQGCQGGAGSAVNCTNCGTLLAHNPAYHGTPTATPSFSNPNPATTAPAAPATAAQNAAGVWHYTCGNGCTGGSGSAVACSTCGNTLAHNAAYHQ